MVAPLDDIRIVTVESWMATPSASAILADMGAEVIKVEPIAGDPMRRTSRSPKKTSDEQKKRYDYQFDVDNRGKLSVACALDTPEGIKLVHKLIGKSHIFMCNLLPRRQKKFSLDPQRLLDINPRLVHATLTGYGTSGPDAERPGYDVTAFFGRSGLYDSMREGDQGIVPMAGPAQGDHTTGLAMVGTILGGLRAAERTGEGQVVETSLYETAIWTQASDYCVSAVDQEPVRRRSREEALSATVNRYPCGDNKWVVITMPPTSAWPVLCRALGREEWLEEERFIDPKARYGNMRELVQAIDETLATKSRDEWGEIFDAQGLIWGPVLGIHEVVRDGQAKAIGMFPEIDSPEIGRYPTVSAPMRFENVVVKPRGPSPRQGEHTRRILQELGQIDDAELDRLIESGIVKDQA